MLLIDKKHQCQAVSGYQVMPAGVPEREGVSLAGTDDFDYLNSDDHVQLESCW
jgi:hypothetical protein